MKEATGYVTDDGTFFESREEAQLHEAESRLRGALAVLHPGADAEMFLATINELREQLGEYLNATNTHQRHQAEVENRAETDDSRASEVSGHIGHVDSTEEDLASLLKLPTRGLSNVPDVGSGSRTEKVQERRTEHGSGVRRDDAPDVRSSKDMATQQGAEAGHARSGRGTKDIQKRKVERNLE